MIVAAGTGNKMGSKAILAGIFASLLLGFGLGQFAFAQTSTPPTTEAPADEAPAPKPDQGTVPQTSEGQSNDEPAGSEGQSGEEVQSDEKSGGPASKSDSGDQAPTVADSIDDIKPPEILRDPSALPFPARRMRELILDAAKSGDIEKLRPYIGYGDDITMLSLGGIEEDPIAFLKSLSGDQDGHEILAILVEVLETGFVQTDPGTEQEIFLWPYFFAHPLDKLTPEQRVELFRIVTHGDYEDMKSFGAYIFYRVGITPKGRWRFVVAGD